MLFKKKKKKKTEKQKTSICEKVYMRHMYAVFRRIKKSDI